MKVALPSRTIVRGRPGQSIGNGWTPTMPPGAMRPQRPELATRRPCIVLGCRRTIPEGIENDRCEYHR